MTDATAGRISVEALAEEFLERRRRGERPKVAEYLARYPHLAGEIRDVFPVLGLEPSAASKRYIRALKRLQEILKSIPGLL